MIFWSQLQTVKFSLFVDSHCFLKTNSTAEEYIQLNSFYED